MKLTLHSAIRAHAVKLGFLFALVPLGVCAVVGVTNAQKAAGWLAYTNKEYTRALEFFAQANDDSGSGLVFLAQHRTADAEAAFERAGDWRGLGLASMQRRQFAEALDAFNRVDDDSGRGLAYLGLHRPADARAAFIRANDWSGLGLVALDQRDLVEARRCFTQVRDHRGLGLAALQDKKFTDAAAHFELADDDAGRAALALAQGHIDVAQALAVKSNDLSLLGACHLARRRLADAEIAFAAAGDWNGLGDVYSRGRQFARAREAFARAHHPVKVIQSFRNDWTLGATDRLEQALAYGRRAVAAETMVPESLCEMADILYELERYQEALDSLAQAATYPGFASETALRRGRIYFYLRDYDNAQAAFASVSAAEVGDLALDSVRRSLRTLERYRGLQMQPAPSF